MEENLRLYNKFKAVPENAKKPIAGGRLKGFTDISPIWRIKMLTESFGPCGIGWNAKVIDIRTITNESVGETAVFMDIELVYRESPDSEWSDPVFGTGGAKMVTSEKGGLYFDDEAYKKAYTDAISVACKSLGIGADVYWEKDRDKYGYSDKSERAPELIEEIFSYGAPNDINAISVKSKGRMVDQLNEKELEAFAEYLRTRKKQKTPQDDPAAESEVQKAEIVRIRKVLLNLAKGNGIDEKTMRQRAEAYLLEKDGVATKFDDMTLDQMIALKVHYPKAIKDVDQAS